MPRSSHRVMQWLKKIYKERVLRMKRGVEMEDKGTNFALLAIVALVAIIALVILLKSQSNEVGVDSPQKNLQGQMARVILDGCDGCKECGIAGKPSCRDCVQTGCPTA